MRKKLIFLFLSLLVSVVSFAQYSEQNSKPNFVSHLRFGGNIGMSFGSYTSILVSPQVGYAITDWFTAGISPEYIYTGSENYNQSVFGMGGYLRAEYAAFFATSSYQYDVVKTNPTYGDQTTNNVSSLWVGGGFRQSMGNRMWMYIGGSYNVLYDKKTSVYGSAFIPTVSVSVGI